MATTIKSPVKGYTGTEVYGGRTLQFSDGEAITKGPLNAGLRLYLQRAGYSVTDGGDLADTNTDPGPANDPADDSGSESEDLIGTGPEQPAANASAKEWRAYAVALGMDDDTVADMNRAEIRKTIENLQGDENNG